MNLLSIGAAYGIMVALFQWAWGGSITDVSPAPVEPWMPMLFAIVFGLSMDYEVFLLSRVREEWLRTGDSHHLGGRQAGRHRQGDHCGGGDHGRGVRQLPAREQPRLQAHGDR
ncbi:MAG: MMPL family transporter [Acidimicrobiales bacterium]